MGFTDKIVWLSDLHITECGRVEGTDCLARLHRAVDEINRWHADAACCVVTGDLVDTGGPGEYVAAARALARLSVPCLPLVGNHDRRDALRAALPMPPGLMPGFLQFRYDTGNLTLLCLDTVEPGQDGGRICAARLDWLRDALDASANRRVLVFMHHPPAKLGLGLQDDLDLAEPEPLLDILAAARQVEHLCFGHTHRPVSGRIRGIPFTGLRALAHQTRAPEPPWTWDDFVAPDERPQYGVILAGPDSLVVHARDLAEA